jgi:CubicO group peptidase (beta-lactamase class C family)
MAMRTAYPLLVAACLVTASDLPAQPAAGHAPPSARGNPDVQFAGQSIDAMIAAFMKEHGVPGLAVAIVQAPYVTRATGFGVADTERRTLVAANTLFDIAQMKNAFTAVAVLQLVEAGKVGLDDPVRRHLPTAEGTSTVRQSLRNPADYPTLERLVAKASGQSYQAFVKKRQFEPLGLRRTVFAGDLPAVPREDVRSGGTHRRFLREPALIDPTEPATGYRRTSPVTPPDGAIYSSASEISVWDIGLAGDILVKDAALRKVLYSPATLENGTRVPTSGPWYFPGHEGLMIATGSGRGFSSLLSRFTRSDELVCVTLLANQEGLDLTQLARKIAGAHNPRLGPPLQAAGLRVQQSPYSVNETMNRLERILRARGVAIMARVDHGKAAASANLTLSPTEELLFGDPANGTPFMQANRALTVDLPLRAAAWEADGAVWVAATDPLEIARRGGLAGHDELALKMRRALDGALLRAVTWP